MNSPFSALTIGFFGAALIWALSFTFLCSHWGCSPIGFLTILLGSIWLLVFVSICLWRMYKNSKELKKPERSSSVLGLIKLGQAKKNAGS